MISTRARHDVASAGSGGSEAVLLEISNKAAISNSNKVKVSPEALLSPASSMKKVRPSRRLSMGMKLPSHIPCVDFCLPRSVLKKSTSAVLFTQADDSKNATRNTEIDAATKPKPSAEPEVGPSSPKRRRTSDSMCDDHRNIDANQRRSARILVNLRESKSKTKPYVFRPEDAMRSMVKMKKIKPCEFELPPDWLKDFRPTMPKFRKTKKNLYRTSRPRTVELDHEAVCNCDKETGDCGEDCINRLLLISCMKDTCPVKDRCKNQAIPRGDNAPFEIFCTDMKGWGIRASAAIPANSFIVEYTGEVIDHEECTKRYADYLELGVQDFYFLTLEDDRIIDAFKYASEGRFINHSCDPNCKVEKWHYGNEPRIAIVSSRDIKKGEEITIDYGYDQFRCQFRQPCFCEAESCRGLIGKGSDLLEGSPDSGDKNIAERCFSCGSGCRPSSDKTINCAYERKGFVCGKTYHTKCVEMSDIPIGAWHCPRHFCDKCSRRALTMCPSCPGSWCRQHYPPPLHRTAEIIEAPCNDCVNEGPQFISQQWAPWQKMLDVLPQTPCDFALPGEMMNRVQ